MFCNCLKWSFFVHLFSSTKLEHVHCSETSLSGDCVYSKALTYLLTRTDVHFTTADRTTEDTAARTKNATPLSNEFSHHVHLWQLGSSHGGCFFRVRRFRVCAFGLWHNLICEPSKLRPCHRWNTHTLVRSSAVLIGGGMRPAAATLRSAVRKLKVAQALGCKTSKWGTNWGSSAHLQITFSLAEPLFQSCGRSVRALPCLAPPQRCLSSWVERALTGRSAQGVHLCPAQGSLQENQGSKSNVPRLWSSCTTDSASNSPHQKSNESEDFFETVSMFPSFVLCFVLFFLPILGSTIWKSETLSSVMSLWLPTCRHGKTQVQTN